MSTDPPSSSDPKIVLPDGQSASESSESQRQEERKSEDQSFVPVIIKRTDETRRHPDDALQHAIEDGLEQLHRPALSLFLTSIAAGLILGFSAMAVAVVITALHDAASPTLGRVATAAVYPLGFVVCILSGAELFTEHSATALYPVLDRRTGWGALLRLWAIVVAGNLLGAVVCAGLHFLARDVIAAAHGYLELGHHLISFDTQSLLVSAILAGWLMALGAWLISASPRTISQILVIYIVTFLIGVGGLHHSIAGSVELFAALFYGASITTAQASRFVGVALVGNLIGGSCFVALLNDAHIRRTNE